MAYKKTKEKENKKKHWDLLFVNRLFYSGLYPEYLSFFFEQSELMFRAH